MKRLMIATVLCALALSGCGVPAVNSTPTPATTPTTGVVAKAGTVIMSAERGFGAAELAYTEAADGVGLLVDAGVIHGATATVFRGLNAKGRDILVRGKATGDLAEKARLATELFGVRDSINALKGSK